MFCTNCGSQVSDSSNFCTNCGAKLQNGPISNYSGQPYQSQPYGGQPVMGHNGLAMKPTKSKTPLFIAIGAAGVISLVLLIFLFTKLFGGVNSSPEKVVKNFFKAFSTQDAKLMLQTMYFEDEDDREKLKDDIDETEWTLEYVNELFKDQLGKNWINKLKIEAGKSKTVNGQTVVTVEVTADVDDEDETLSIKVIKEKGKYYIDPVSLNMLY